jgi:hypothetical protein
VYKLVAGEIIQQLQGASTLSLCSNKSHSSFTSVIIDFQETKTVAGLEIYLPVSTVFSYFLSLVGVVIQVSGWHAVGNNQTVQQ